MAFDGVTIANVVKEMKETLVGGRIYKIAQPEEDELLITVKTREGQSRLFISAGASLPLIYLTKQNKPSPMTAPGFCMLLRKHLQNGRIVNIFQPGLERIVHIEVEHLDEMGDLRHKTLIVEIMGKHSNIIFCGEDDTIIDSIKHISGLVSSVREVLPGKPYFIAQTQDKADPLTADFDSFRTSLTAKPSTIYKAVYSCYTGISPILSQELCHEAGIDGDLPASAMEDQELQALYGAFSRLITNIREGYFTPNIIYVKEQPLEYAAVPLTIYSDMGNTSIYENMSSLLEAFYTEKNAITRIRQKSADLRRIVQTALDRNLKKYDLQLKQMKDTAKRDTYRIYGELLNTYGYNVEPGARLLEAENYYDDNKLITIPLDPTMTPQENAKKYFEKYNRLKRTYEALTELTEEVKTEIDHLESISASLDIALLEEDLVQIKEELTESGYIKRKGSRGKVRVTSRPFHYISSDGFHIYVGKNNYQNDELTFKFATGNDWWFHAKKMPGSHVIVRTEGAEEVPDRTFEEAGRLAAYYSKGRGQDKVEIDYIQKKHVKKPAGANPGFVVYYTNYSLMIGSDISGIQQLDV